MVRRISSAQWWAQVEKTYTLLREYVGRAKRTEREELREAGAEHDCGHQFKITISSAMHSGIEGAGPKSHRDADWWGDCRPVTVRAHNLRDALLVASTLPLNEFFYDGDESNG